MAELSDQDIREAARETGLSPEEVRLALRDSKHGQALAPMGLGETMGPPSRGTSVHNAEHALPLPPREAVLAVRRRVERELGARGHQQGDHEADVVDDAHGLTYRIRAEDDGRGGALVRVDVDPTAARARKLMFGALAGAAGVAAGTFFLLFGFALLPVLATGTVGGLGLWGYLRALAAEQQGLTRARRLGDAALVAAEEHAARQALEAAPPEGR